MNGQELLLSIAVITSIIVGLPCLLVRPLLVAIADRIAGKKSGAKEMQEMKVRIECLEKEMKNLRVHLISVESSQEFSNKLLEDLKSQASKTEP